MKIVLTVNHLENAAFDNNMAVELARILREAANHVENDPLSPVVLRDVNGNRVGIMDVVDE